MVSRHLSGESMGDVTIAQSLKNAGYVSVEGFPCGGELKRRRRTLAWSGPAGDRFGMEERPWPPAAQASNVMRKESIRLGGKDDQ